MRLRWNMEQAIIQDESLELFRQCREQDCKMVGFETYLKRPSPKEKRAFDI